MLSSPERRSAGYRETPTAGSLAHTATHGARSSTPKRPRLIARCADVADVINAVKFGCANNLLIAIRGGGHNGAGLGSCDDGLVIDLSLMKGVRIHPATATVRAESGCTQGDVDHACHAFGLAVPAGIVSTTGLAGLTLGGGTGYMTRRFGLTIDNLIEADVVLADGRLVTASNVQNEDLFWGLRGGGSNFGVVTSFLFRAFPASMVLAGPMMWEIKHARQIMRWYRDFLPTAPLELCTFLGLKTVPSTEPFPKEFWGRKIVALISCYNGRAEDGEKAIQPLRSTLPTPMLDWVVPMPFPSFQSLFDSLLPKGLQWYWKGAYVKELPRPGNRCPPRICHASAERAFTYASLSHRRDRAQRWQARVGVDLPRCHLVDGHRRYRRQSRGAAEHGLLAAVESKTIP